MARKGQVFNSLKRQKLLRKQIPGTEAAVGVVCLVALLISGAWIALQRDNFDPGERDVTMATLKQDIVLDTLYKTPLQRWRDPAAGSVAGAAPLELGPYPASVLSPGWTASGRVETFTPENLYEKINGQAEQYLKFDFQELNALTLEGEGVAIDMFLYDQGGFANCLGLYQEQRGSKPVERQGDVLYTLTVLGAYGMVGRTFFHLIGTAEGEPVATKTQQLLEQLNALAASDPTPAPFEVLRDVLGVPLDRVGYTPVNVFQYGFAQRFWFGSLLEDGATGQVYLHQAADEPEAQALLDRLLKEQRMEYAAIEGSDLLQHEYLKTIFSAAREGAVVYGVNDYPDSAAAEAALQQVRAALAPEGDEGYEGDH